MTNTVGRPPFFKTPEELQAKVDEYFNNCPDKVYAEINGLPGGKSCYTKCGLALALGFADRQSLYDYEAKPEFTCIIKKATTRVELGYELRLHGKNPTGAIFALKNMGWNDKIINENHNHSDVDVPARMGKDEWVKRQKEKNAKTN